MARRTSRIPPSGTLASRLLKPIHPLLAYSAENLAAIPLRALFALPVAVIGLASGGAHLPHGAFSFAALAAALAGAWFLSFFVMAVIGMLSFFIDSSASVFEVWLACFMLLSGYLVPLDLFPS